MLTWILRVIGLLLLTQAMDRIGIRPGAKSTPRAPAGRAPAVDPAQVIEAKFRPVSPPTPGRPGDQAR